MRENFKTEMSETLTCGRKTYSLQQITASQLLPDEQQLQTKKSIYLRDSYQSIKLPQFKAQKQQQLQHNQTDNIIISGKTYLSKAMEHQYLRIQANNQSSSLSCQINCTSQFQIMISQIHPFPISYNCEQLINNRGFIVSVIFGEYIYVSFISRKDSALQFYLKFCSQNEECLRVKTLSDMPTENQTTKNGSKSVLFIIHSNREAAGVKRNRYEDEMFRQEKYFQVLSTRNFSRKQNTQAKKQKLFDLKAKELANKEKILVKLINYKKSQREILEHQWYTIIFTLNLAQQIIRLYFHKKRIIQKNRLAAFHIKFHLRKIKAFFQSQKGDTVEFRALVDSAIALKTKAKMIRKVIKQKQVKIMLPILNERSYIYEVKKRMLKFSGKLSIIKKHILEFEELYFKYKNEMLLKWDNYNERIKEEEIKVKQASHRNKELVTWFHIMNNKDFSQQMRKCFFFELMRDRIRGHLKDQQIVKKYKLDLKYYKSKLKICRDHIEAMTLRTEIFGLTNDIYAMCMKNSLFMHCDITKYFNSLVSKYIALVDAPEILPELLDNQPNLKTKQSRVSLRKGIKKSKL